MSVSVYTTNQLNKDLKKKFTKTFDLSQIAEDPMDSYLDTLGLWKKRIARDGSCLFRAVAEQIYPCQMYHEKVRQECIRYMSDNREEYSKYVSTISFDEYLEAMKNPLENGGQLEIAAMSKLYRRDFIIFQHQDQPGVDVTQNGFEKKIYLCYSYNNHFDAIFSKAHRDRLAIIQSLVYEMLYDRVFGSGEQVQVARKLLRKSDTIYPKEYMKIKQYDEFGNEIESDEEEDDHDLLDDLNQVSEDENSEEETETGEDEQENDNENKKDQENDFESSDQNNNDTRVKNNNKKSPKKPKKLDTSDDKVNIIQKMPLPYKVAKSLDPYIYRNTAFDAWLATKKELEQAANLNAISVLQPGDKCMVKLISNYTEKWSLAFLQNILHDSANVFVPELNESHCVSLENLKVYNNANELLLIHYTGNQGQQYHPVPYPQSNPNGVQNVQKFVQSINANFSKIFINAENKRRSSKKKQFAMKKSSSFHAFSTELPTLVEVEEQNDDIFLYGGHHGYYHAHHHHGHHHHPHHSYHHQGNSHMPSSQTFYSIPHSQTHPNFTDHLTTTNKPLQSSNKTNQISANLQSNHNNINSTQQHQSNTQNNNNNKTRRPRFNQNGSQNLNNNNKNSWPNNNNGPNSNPPYLAHQLAPPLAPQLAPNQPGHLSLTGGLNLPPPPPPMGPLVGPGQAFLAPPPPPIQPLHPHPQGGASAFMHHPPPPPQPPTLGPHPHGPPPPQLPHHQPRPNFFNPFMFAPPQPVPPPPMPHLNHQHPMPGLIDPQNPPPFYFPPSKTNLIERKQRHESVDSYLNKSNHTSSSSYQQVPQHLTNAQTNTNGENGAQVTNPNNYLLMPAPPANSQTNQTSLLQPVISTTPGSYTTTSSLTRSHSYHSGISSYESHNQLVNPNTNSSNVYVDVYNMPPANNQQSHLQAPGNQSGVIGTNTNGQGQQQQQQQQSIMMHQTNGANTNLTAGLANANNNNQQQLYSSIGLEGNNLSYNNTGFSGYDMQYSRFDNSLTTNSNGIIEDNLLNSGDRSSNLWNKPNKLTKSTSLFSDMMYAGESTQTNVMPMPNNANNQQQFCYSNCFVVNIDGPINFNATHSLQDDGADLPFNDINTIRFFYNLGIEYYRLNIAAPYNPAPSYSTIYAPNTNMTSSSNVVNGTMQNSNSSNSLSTALPNDTQQMNNNEPSSTVQATNPQVVPNTKQQQSIMQQQQQSYNSTRRVH